MKISKLGHCCLFIEEKGKRILTDPGSYTEAQNDVTGIDVVLITHEHTDHFHIDSVKKILENNPEVTMVTNTSVDNLLKKEGINTAIILDDGNEKEIFGVHFSAHGQKHALIHKDWPVVENTGYFIGERLYYPGDDFYNPKIAIEILALPVAGSWMKISEAIDYAIEVKPKIAFPVHDGLLNSFGEEVIKRVPTQILEKHGINFTNLEIGKEYEF